MASNVVNMKNLILVKTVLIAAALPILAGCVERQVVYRDRPVYVQQPAPVAPPPNAEVVVQQPTEPPLPQIEVRPVAPGPAFIWIDGFWDWRGRWVWVGGHWDRPRPGAVWVRGGWEHRGHGYVWVGARWR
jgi:hypothetical protein